MKHRQYRWLPALLCALLCCALLLCCAVVSFGADTTFEKSIAAFPESYRVKLRALHEAHPTWEFTALTTGLDWTASVDAESSGGRSLVDISANYASAFKSKATGDYNYTTGAYIQKDGGFCTANKFCVSYFMDPRNFLNEENIFQFEQLSFDASFDVEAVDVVLSGTFMYQKKITYVTASGESKSMNQTYAEVIYEAGETYNVNPCYLASKIRNEIGSTPSGSVTGKNSTYPGIYNFYNIGASDGAGAITRGLAWAANTTAGTYQRPWDTPKKSIMGGAQYIVNTYIGKGQFTGYYQRFNVNPNGSYKVYDHQYMTNVSGAASQGYSSYRSYLSMGLLDQHFIFSIPVFTNMPGSADNTGTLKLNDAVNQTVTVSTTSAINVRTGPSTNYDKLAFQLSPGTAMTVLAAYPTDSHYFDSVLRYPVWYQVQFKYDGTTYKGYVPAGFTAVSSTKTVAPGLYTPQFTTTNKSLYFNFVSMDARIVSVVNDRQLNFLKEGTANVIAYDSSGRYAVVRYVVSSSAPPNEAGDPVAVLDGVGTVTSISQTDVTETGFKLSWGAVSGATGYRVYQLNTATDRYESLITTTKTSYTLTGLSTGATVTMKVKAYRKADGVTTWGEASAAFKAMTIPNGPSSLAQAESYSNSVTLTWSGVSGAKRYQVVQYDPAAKTFNAVQTTEGNTLSISALLPATDYQFKVRAVVAIGGKEYYTPYSYVVTAKTGPEPVTGLRQTGATEGSIALAWDAAQSADGYKLYRYNIEQGTFTLVGKTNANTFTVSDLPTGYYAVYVVKSYIKEDGIVYYSSTSEEMLATTLPAKTEQLKQFSTKSTCLKLQWAAVPNATGYCVYRVTAAGSHKKLATVENNKALISNLKPGTHYNFQVRAFIRSGGKVYWGAFSDTYTALTNPAKVENLTISAQSAKNVRLQWKALKGVTGYRVYRYDANGTAKLVTVVTKNTAKFTATPGAYAVRAYINENGVNYFGAYSDKVTVS